MKKIFLLFSIILIFFISCDILEHDNYSNDKIENFFTDFSNTLSITNADNIDNLKNFYAENYSNNLQTRDEMMDFYESFFLINTVVNLEAELIDYNRFGEIKWNINEFRSGAFYQTISMEDVLTLDNPIKFIGNQIDPPELDPSKPVVFAEMFTGEQCGNCPPVANHLHHLKNVLGEQFIYVEYCQSNNHTPFYIDYVSYYDYWEQPTTMIGGTNAIVGGSEESLNLIDAYSDAVINSGLQATLSNLNADKINGILTGTINVELIDLSTENLILTVVLADGNPEIYYTGTTEQFHNVAFAKTEIAITESGLINFTIDYDSSIDFVQPKVIAWLQTKKPSYDTECKTYSATEYIIGE
jgi:hypothetical protein